MQDYKISLRKISSNIITIQKTIKANSKLAAKEKFLEDLRVNHYWFYNQLNQEYINYKVVFENDSIII